MADTPDGPLQIPPLRPVVACPHCGGVAELVAEGKWARADDDAGYLTAHYRHAGCPNAGRARAAAIAGINGLTLPRPPRRRWRPFARSRG